MQTLIIADNKRQAEFIRQGFKYEHLPADVCGTNDREALKKMYVFYDGFFIVSDNPDVLDAITRDCRELKKDNPFFVLLQEFNENNLALCNSLTDRTYIRPFAFRSIASDMRQAIFRVKELNQQSSFVLRDLELDLNRHIVKMRRKIVSLRNKEFALLHFLMINAGKVLSRNTILEHVWDRNANILTNTVDVHISQLRKKIEKKTNDKYIHTIPCTGYILT